MGYVTRSCMCLGLELAAHAAAATRTARNPGRIRDLKGKEETSVDFAFFGGEMCRVPAETRATPVPCPAGAAARDPPHGRAGAPPVHERPPAGHVPPRTHAPRVLRGSRAAAEPALPAAAGEVLGGARVPRGCAGRGATAGVGQHRSPPCRMDALATRAAAGWQN